MFREDDKKLLENYEYKKLLWQSSKKEIEEEKHAILAKMRHFQEWKSDGEKVAFESEFDDFIETFFNNKKMLEREKKLEKIKQAYEETEDLKLKIFKSFYNKKVTSDFLIKYDQNEVIMKKVNFPRDIQYIYISENALQLTPKIFRTGGQDIKLFWNEKITYKENISRTLKVEKALDKENARIKKEYQEQKNHKKK